MGKLSRTKGKAFERWFATKLREWFGHAGKADLGVRRGLQSRGGGKEIADVVCDELSWVHFECEHAKAPNPRAKMAQAVHDIAASGRDLVPVVVTKQDGESEPLATMRLTDWLELVQDARRE